MIGIKRYRQLVIFLMVKLFVIFSILAIWWIWGDPLAHGYWLKLILLGLFLTTLVFSYLIYSVSFGYFKKRDETRILVEKQLLAYSNKLAGLLDRPEEASVFKLDPDYNLLFFNQNFEKEIKRIFDIDIEVGMSIWGLIPNVFNQVSKINFSKAFSGQSLTTTYRYGQNYYMQMYQPDVEGKKITGITCTIFDVTERIQAEQEMESYKEQLEHDVRVRTKEIHQQSAFFQSVLDNLPNLVFVRNDRGEYVLVNKASAESFGKTVNELIGKKTTETHNDPEQAERFEKEDKLILSENRVFEEEILQVYPDGSEHWLYFTKRKMQIGNDYYILGVHNDISSLKETEFKLLKANEDLKEALDELKSAQMRLVESEKMASLGQLTAGLAHEINNPINYVAGNVNPIKKDLHELKKILKDCAEDPIVKQNETAIADLFKELESLLEGVAEGANRVNSLMQDLKNFALPDREARQMCDINSSIVSTINLISYHIKDQITLEKDLKDLPAVYCNSMQISQVVLNLINNAIQAIEEKGKIVIRSYRQNDEVVIEVQDTGTGIAPEHLHRIFEPFFTTKDVGEGTGLGLSISYRIIKEHQGTIEVNSSESGTTFYVRLPIVSV